MNFIDKKDYQQYPDEIKNLFTLFKIDNIYPKLLGSASLKSQQYYGDFDFYLYIGNFDHGQFYDQLKNILNKIIENYNYYFIELKVQSKNDDKYKWFYGEDFLKDDFMKIKDIDFVKVDLVIFMESRFYDVSVIYQFGKTKYDVKKSSKFFIDKLNKDIKELKKEKKYYKILKRIYSINKLKNNKAQNNELNKFFNSDSGKLYSIYNNIEAIINANQYYDDDNDYIKRRNINLKNLNITNNKLQAYSKDILKEINLKALDKIKELGIKV